MLTLLATSVFAAGSFTDVPKTHWAYGAIERAVDAGLLQGYDGQFHGARLLNRYQIAVIASKILDKVQKAEGKVPAGVGKDLDKLLEEFADELSLMNSRLTAVEEKLASVTGQGGEIKISGAQVVCDDKCEVKFTGAVQGEERTSTVYSRKGKSLKIGGIVKTWYDDVESADASEFDLRNARLLLIGGISKDLKFVLQTEMAHNGSADIMRDLKLMINLSKCDPWKTYVQVGRFIPNFMKYQPKLIDTIDFVHYPVLTNQLAVWRQSGMEIYHTMDSLKFTFGILNGTDPNDNNWTGDISTQGAGENDAQDYMIRADFAPKNSSLSGAVYYWDGSYGTNEYDRTRLGAFVDYNKNPFRFTAEYITATNGSATGDLDMSGYYVQAIHHQKASRLEYLVRYDDYDPNEDADDDDIQWLTLGVNWFLEGRDCFFSVNYIDKEEGLTTDTEVIGQLTFIF
jgi:hypothetical protein